MLVTRALPRPVLAAAVLPLVVIVGFQSAWAAYACSADGEVRDHCCCPAKQDDDREPADGAPRIERQACCAISQHSSPDVPVAREVAREAFTPLVLIVPAAPLALITPPAQRDTTTIATMARPPPRVALYLDKHALLR